MAAITSAQSGLSNATSTWVGGVIPVEGDNVTIALGHTVTITGTHIWGNDTTTAALTIAGSCVFSTVANTDLTLKGTMVNTGTAAVWQRGTIASPMPSNITSRVRTNYSATLANNKYNISFGATARFAEWSEVGATRNRQFQVAAAISAGATSITVSDATGFKVGDIIFLEATNTTAAEREHRVLTSVSGNVISWTTGLVNARIAGAYGGNLSSNVLWQSFSGSFGAYVQVICQTTQAAATINIKQVSTHGLYGQADVAGFTIGGTNAVTVENSPVGIVDNLASCDLLPDGSNAAINLGNAQFGVRLGYSGSWTYPVVYTRLGGFAVYTSSGGTGYFNNAFFSGLNSPIISQFSQGGVGCKIVNSRITNVSQLNGGASMIGFSMENVTMDGAGAIVGILQGDYTINNCSFGQVYGISGSTLITNSNNSLSTLTFSNCLFPSGKLMVSPSLYQNALVNKPVTILNKNADPSLQEIYLNTGAIFRDNAQLFRSRSSIKFSPYIANTPHGYTFTTPASAGVVTRFKFGLRYDATYGTATPPSVTVSGLGITPQTFTAGGSANTDYSQAITVTPVTSGLLTITISGQTTSTLGTGNYWFSGMSVNPFIDWTQWYGFAYNPSSATLTIDPVVVLSESAAEGLSGISLASNTITIASSLTLSNVYDWLKWYESTNRFDPIITSTNGVNFISTANVSITSGSLTGGNITAPLFTLVSAPTNIALTGSVSQATPTNLTGVDIVGNLTYNTNTPITVTLTNCSISGTISNSGTGLVTINLTNSTIGSVGANVASRLTTSLTINGLTAGSQIYIANGIGAQVDYVASSGTSYTLDTTGGTGTWTYKVARYGFTSQSGNHSPALANTIVSITLISDAFITEATKTTVAAYTTLENPDKIYDYSAYFETTNAGIVIPRVILKEATFASAGSYALVLNNTGAVWNLAGGILTLRITNNFVGGSTITGGLLTTGAITLNAQASSAGNYAIINGNSISIFAANYQNIAAITSITGFPTTGAISAAGSIDFGNSTIAATGDLSASNTSLTGVLNIITASNRILNLTDCSSSNFTINASGGGSVLVRCLGTTLATAITAGTNVAIIKVAPITAPNLLSGSRVRLYNVTDGVEIYNAVLLSAGFSYDYSWTANKTMKLTVTYQSGTTAKLAFEATGVVTSSGLQFLNSQEDDTIYNAYALNGSSITKFQADYVNDEIDLKIASDFLATELYAWWVYNLTTINGIRDFVGGITAQDAANLRINTNIISIKLDNITASDLLQTDNIRIYRSDLVYPVARPTSGGGGINVNWQNQVYVADLDSSTIKKIFINTNALMSTI